MLQIIGWLGCAYLIVKALEIAGNNGNRDAEGIMTGYAMIASAVAWIAALGFAVLFYIQGNAMAPAASPYLSGSSYSGIGDSKTSAEIEAEATEAAAEAMDAAADAAAAASEAAAAAAETAREFSEGSN